MPIMRKGFVRLKISIILFSLAGCTYVNKPLNDASVPAERQTRNHTLAETFTSLAPEGALILPNITPGHGELRPSNSPTAHPSINGNGYFVGLAISGGGSRSANFAAACMFQLQRIGMLQKVNYISSVSGGSLAAAYYCLNDADWNPKTVEEKLTHSFASDIWFHGFLPWNVIALTFTDFDRSDLLAQTLNEHLFSRGGRTLTYADLLPNRPRLLINATDLQSGRRFIFCNRSFDEINSDLAKYPISYAVAASSSVPVVLHQVTLRDYSTTFDQYRHLLDGGLTDDLGIESLVETYRSQVDAAVHHGMTDPYPNGAIFILLDARVQFDTNVNSQRGVGLFASIRAAAGLTTASLVSRSSAASLDDVILRNAPDTATAKQIRDGIDQLNREGYIEFQNIGGHPIRVADFALTQVASLQHMPFNGFTESINSINTYFNITPEAAHDLYVAAELLMKDRFEDKLKPLVDEMNSTSH